MFYLSAHFKSDFSITDKVWNNYAVYICINTKKQLQQPNVFIYLVWPPDKECE